MATVTVHGETFESRTLDVPDGTRLANAIEAAGIDILHRCGGFARCTTCRVTFQAGEPENVSAAEATKLADKGDTGAYRLSCQIACAGEMEVTVLMTMTGTGLPDPGPALDAHIP
jgi:ferredoxin